MANSARLYLAGALCTVLLLHVEAIYPARRSDRGSLSGSVGGCPRLNLDNGRVRGRQRARLVRFLCLPGYELVGNKYATCSYKNWDVPTPVCTRPGCTELPIIEHGIRLSSHQSAFNIFFCNPGYQITGSNVVYCNGIRWNATVPVCVDTSKPPALKCDFESSDWCGWRNDEFHDFDWRRYSKYTPSAFMNTGPSHDHTLGPGGTGHYLYVESTGKQENERARLLSPIYDAKIARGGCFSIYYHMFGKTTGKLRVYQKPIGLDLAHLLGAKESSYQLLEKEGNQGDRWYRAVLPLQNFNEDFQMLIEGVRGSSFTSDIAIDDAAIIVSQEECQQAIGALEPVSLPTASSLDSCVGRCFSDRIFSELGDTFECSCEDSCLDNNACCADFRDLCEMPDVSSSDVSDDWSAASWTPHELIPQTMKLVATSTVSTSAETTPERSTTVTAREKTTLQKITTKLIPRTPVMSPATTMPTTFTSSTASTIMFTTTLGTTTAKTTVRAAISKISTLLTKRAAMTTSIPRMTKEIPKLMFKSTTRAPYNATGILSRNATVVLPSKLAKTTLRPTSVVTINTWTPDDIEPISRTFENHNSYHKLVKERNSKQTQKGKDNSGSTAVWCWTIGTVVVLVGMFAMGVAIRKAAQQRRGHCADEVRYLTQDDHLDFDSPE